MSSYSEQQMAHARVVARAWNDPAYQQRLLQDPHAALGEEGVTVPDGTQVKVVQNTPTLQHLVLPAKPPTGTADTGAALGAISEGIIGSTRRTADGIIGSGGGQADGIIGSGGLADGIIGQGGGAHTEGIIGQGGGAHTEGIIGQGGGAHTEGIIGEGGGAHTEGIIGQGGGASEGIIGQSGASEGIIGPSGEGNPGTPGSSGGA